MSEFSNDFGSGGPAPAAAAPATTARLSPRPVRVWRGLLAQQWRVGGGLIAWGAAVAFLGGWALMAFHHPVWVLVLGSLWAVLLGVVFGGTWAAEGAEEFAFALPPTRGQHYLSRLLLAGGSMVLVLSAALLAIALDLPQRVWALAVESGFTEPFPPARTSALYGLALAAPAFTFSVTFAMSALARSRAGLTTAWAAGIVLIVILIIALAAESAPGRGYTATEGWLAAAILAGASIGVLLVGHRLYLVKEGISRPSAPASAGRWGWVVALIIGLLLLFLLVSFAVCTRSRPEAAVFPRPAVSERSLP